MKVCRAAALVGVNTGVQMNEHKLKYKTLSFLPLLLLEI